MQYPPYKILIQTTTGMPQIEFDHYGPTDGAAIEYARNIVAQMEGVRWFMSASVFKAGDDEIEPTLVTTLRLKCVVQ